MEMTYKLRFIFFNLFSFLIPFFGSFFTCYIYGDSWRTMWTRNV